NPVPTQLGHWVITVCFSTSNFSLMFSLSMRNSPVPWQSGQRWAPVSSWMLKTPVLSWVEEAMVHLLGGFGSSTLATNRPKTKPAASGRGLLSRPCGVRASGGLALGLGVVVEELFVLGGALQGRRGGIGLDGGRDGVEVAGAHLALVLHGREALLGGRELL